MSTLFAQNLRSLRQKKTLTQTELAERSGLSRRTVAYWEAGTTLPRIPELQAALRVMEATSEEAALLIDQLNMPRGERAAGEKQTSAVTGLSDLLRVMRHRHRLTQAELAAQLRINRQAVLRWESGQNRISGENLERLCDLLHAAPEERQALQAHRLIMPHWAEENWQRINVEEASHLWYEMQKPHHILSPDYCPQSPLFELQVLAMKRHLYSHTRRGMEVRPLLARLESDHALWLHFQNRVPEARACSSCFASGSGRDCSTGFLGRYAQSCSVGGVSGESQRRPCYEPARNRGMAAAPASRIRPHPTIM